MWLGAFARGNDGVVVVGFVAQGEGEGGGSWVYRAG